MRLTNVYSAFPSELIRYELWRTKDKQLYEVL